LDVIGAGATATSDTDWHAVWKRSPEATFLQKNIQDVIDQGRNRPVVQEEKHSEFSASWMFQFRTLLQRDFERHWRDPTYLLAKLALNITAGLFIGFTFFKAKNTIQGTQNKIFVSYLFISIARHDHLTSTAGYLHEYHQRRFSREPDSGTLHQYPHYL
jgi:ATP-binding cassette, subfamily G (WHITE), member 2, SNQ2